jgi:hypothetical protein
LGEETQIMANSNDDEDVPTSKSKSSSGEGGRATSPARADGAWHNFLVTIAVMVGALACFVGYFVHRLGWSFLLPFSMRTLHFSSPEQVRDLVKGHKFLFVGGPHRGGTTLLWRCLREHESISGFADKVGSDYSEGMFLQTVMPQFGIGTEKAGGSPGLANTLGAGSGSTGGSGRMNPRIAQGMGRFGFDIMSNMLQDDPRLSAENQELLLGQWGHMWNLTLPILMEKSPPNMLTSRFLQRMFSPDVDAQDWTAKSSRASFLFVTRHPLANSLALTKWIAPRSRNDLFELVLHWVITHETLRADRKHLVRSKLVKLEDFAMAPDRYLAEIYEWMDLPPKGAPLHVSSSPNEKYMKHYCATLRESEAAADRHRRLVAKLNDRVKALGYDLNEWSCIAESIGRSRRGGKT